MPKWTTKEIKTMKRLYKKGLSNKDIANELNRTPASTRGVIVKLQKAGTLPYRNRYKGIRDETPNSQKAETWYFQQTQMEKIADTASLSPKARDAIVEAYKEVDGYTVDNVKKDIHWATHHSKKTSTAQKIQSECDQIKAFLIAKNLAYGDSALYPIRIFSHCDITEQIKVRIDDKLNRLLQGNSAIEADEDIIRDLIGYFVLLLVQLHDETQ